MQETAPFPVERKVRNSDQANEGGWCSHFLSDRINIDDQLAIHESIQKWVHGVFMMRKVKSAELAVRVMTIYLKMKSGFVDRSRFAVRNLQ